MSTRGIALLVTAMVLVLVAVIGGGGWMAWKARLAKRATDEVLQAERDADRAEAIATFANPVPPSPEENAEFQRFFGDLAATLDRGDAAGAAAVFDIDRMADELSRNGALDKLSARERAGFRRGMREGASNVGASLVNNELMRWNRTDIRRVRWSEDRKEAVVIAVHHEALPEGNTRLKFRWWLKRHGDGWRVYDFEDLDMGMRSTLLMRSMLNSQPLADIANNAMAIRSATEEIRIAMVALLKEQDAEKAEQAMARIRNARLPVFLAACREMVEAMLLFNQGEYEQSLVRLENSDRLQPGMPAVKLLKAAAFNQTQKHDEALRLAREYIAELGPDAVALLQVGLAHEFLNRPVEALDAYRQGLDDDPDEVECLQGLRRTLPVDQKNELGTRLDKSTRAMEHFDAMLPQSRADQDDASTQALIAWLRKVKPDDIRGRSEELRQLILAKKFPEAIARFQKEYAGAKPEERDDLFNLFLSSMSAAEKRIEAYQAVPKDRAGIAFSRLAVWLSDDLEIDDPANPSPEAKQLAELITAHRARDPGDPALWFYEGVLLQHREEFEKAEKLFAEGAKKLAQRPAPDDDDVDSLTADDFRYRRVACFIALKKAMKAYTEVGPSEETFQQLAWHFNTQRDDVSLSQLVAEHRKGFARAVSLKYWSGEVLFLQGKYVQAANTFAAYREAATEKDRDWYSVPERCVRSWLKAERSNDARRAIRTLGEKSVTFAMRAAVEALDGDPAAVERIIEEANQASVNMWQFYLDEDFVRLTAGPKFAALRAKYPDPRPKPMQKAG